MALGQSLVAELPGIRRLAERLAPLGEGAGRSIRSFQAKRSRSKMRNGMLRSHFNRCSKDGRQGNPNSASSTVLGSGSSHFTITVTWSVENRLQFVQDLLR